jgi:choline monooxygenase
MIAKAAFLDEDVLRRESIALFADGFVFAGLTTELANERDFVTVDGAGAAIVVQNFKGELRAFQNVCAHQFAKVQVDVRGNRPLMCRYHGWNYDASGFPFGIPKRSEYELEGVPRECLSLKPYRVETCGIFVFVCALDCPIDLPAFLGSFRDTLEELSRHIGPEYKFAEIPHAANWKLLVENVLDNYHCTTLHPQTFLADGFCRTPPEQVVVDGPHSSFHVRRTPTGREEQEALRRRFLSHLAKRSLTHDSYFHIFIFPNLFVASTEGTTFFVGQALPHAAGQTNLRLRYLEPAGLPARSRGRQDMVNQTYSENGLKIIVEEDLPVLETVQKGLAISDRPGFIGAGETRIRAWRESYARAMEQGLAAALPVAPATVADVA